MLRIRLQRKGRKKRPIFHLVVADSRSARDGRIIEQVGRFDNVTEKKEVVLKEDRILYWLDTGAQPSDTVRKILRNEGVLYKRHLKMWGKSDEEIEAALEEWKAYRDSKSNGEESRKDTLKDVLAAEEKEFKAQVEQKAKKAAAELEAEAVEESNEEEAATVEVEAEAETTTEENTETEAAEEEEKETEVAEEEVTEETTEAEEVVEEAKAEESADSNSNDMSAKDAIDHIKNNDVDALKGFIADDESRKTVLAAWEEKQSEG